MPAPTMLMLRCKQWGRFVAQPLGHMSSIRIKPAHPARGEEAAGACQVGCSPSLPRRVQMLVAGDGRQSASKALGWPSWDKVVPVLQWALMVQLDIVTLMVLKLTGAATPRAVGLADRARADGDRARAGQSLATHRGGVDSGFRRRWRSDGDALPTFCIRTRPAGCCLKSSRVRVSLGISFFSFWRCFPEPSFPP